MTEKQRREWANFDGAWILKGATPDGNIKEYEMQHCGAFFLKVMVRESVVDWESCLKREGSRDKRIESWERRGLYQVIKDADGNIEELRNISQTNMYEIMKEAEKENKC